jgi:hypothetical protein
LNRSIDCSFVNTFYQEHFPYDLLIGHAVVGDDVRLRFNAVHGFKGHKKRLEVRGRAGDKGFVYVEKGDGGHKAWVFVIKYMTF